MRMVGIDIGAQEHVVAVVDEHEAVVLRPHSFGEDAAGYGELFQLLARAGAGGGEELPQAPASAGGAAVLVVMEATGHYWINLFGALVAQGYAVALVNPLRTHRFAGEELARTKTDRIDALQLARFAVQKRPPATPLPQAATEELRELVRLRARLTQEMVDRVNQLHRLVDLGFPEFTRYVKDLNTELAGAILSPYPTAVALRQASRKRLARLSTDGRHQVGDELAGALLQAAQHSVGSQHTAAHRTGVRYACEDLAILRRRLKQLDRELAAKLEQHQVGKLLTTIPGIGTNTAATLCAELGDLSRFNNLKALAAYLGLCPGHRHCGQHRPKSAPLAPIGNARLRRALWMPTLNAATRSNPWLMAFYNQLVARGKPHKVALIAAMRKLLGAIYSVAKHRRPFIPILNSPPPIAAEIPCS